MDLKEYFSVCSEKKRLSKRAFARKVNIELPTVERILNGSDIRLSVAHDIVKATEGLISYEDLYKNIKIKDRKQPNSPQD